MGVGPLGLSIFIAEFTRWSANKFTDAASLVKLIGGAATASAASAVGADGNDGVSSAGAATSSGDGDGEGDLT